MRSVQSSSLLLCCPLEVFLKFIFCENLWKWLQLCLSMSPCCFFHSILYTQDMLKSCLACQLPCLANSSLLHQRSIISTSSLLFKCTEFFSSVPWFWRIPHCNILQGQVLWAPKLSSTLLLSEMICKAERKRKERKEKKERKRGRRGGNWKETKKNYWNTVELHLRACQAQGTEQNYAL